MLVSSIYRGLCRTRSLYRDIALASLSNNVSYGRLASHVDSERTRKANVSFTSRKNYSSETQTQPGVVLPPLCDFPIALWPKLFNTFRNFITMSVVIKARLDQEFNEVEFVEATTHALYVVSRALANENYEQLEGLVTPQVIESLKGKISTLSPEQKRCIAVEDEDVYMSFPSSVQVLNEGDKGHERTFVEIMMVHHYMQGLGRMKKAGEALPTNIRSIRKEQIFVANYRFIREFTENVDSSWIINVVNHFSPYFTIEQQ